MRFDSTNCVIVTTSILALSFAGGEAQSQVPRGRFSNVIRLGPNINTATYDTVQSLSPDGLTIYFTSFRENGYGGADLYQATRPDVSEPFGPAMNLGPNINSSDFDNFPSISLDGLTLYFASNRSEGEGRFDLYQATRSTVKDTFGEVMNLGPAVNTEFAERGPDISPDGLTLYFTSNDPAGEGGDDIYAATRVSLTEPFTNVTNLGPGINGSSHEFDPSVSSDGLFMFFSDSFAEPFRPDGPGGPDIWVAMRQSTDEPFRDVVNLNSFSLGSEINSEFFENGPLISHDWPEPGSLLYFSAPPTPDGSGDLDIFQATWVTEFLLPGDADQDLDFDQADLVRASQSAKYLTGESATWGEGDWNGAPGGSPGNPPVGDETFDQLDILATLRAGHYLSGPYASIRPAGTIGDDQTSVIYNAGTGELAVDAPSGQELTSINITSISGAFIGVKPPILDGAFDNFAADNVFKATFGGSFGSISFGNILRADISEADLVADLSAVGSLAGGGDLGEVDLVYIPEPASALLLLCGALAMILMRRR